MCHTVTLFMWLVNVPHSDSVSQMSNFPFCQLFEDQKLYERCLLKILDIFFLRNSCCGLDSRPSFFFFGILNFPRWGTTEVLYSHSLPWSFPDPEALLSSNPVPPCSICIAGNDNG